MSYHEFYLKLYAMKFPVVHAAMLFAVFFWAFVSFLFGVGKKSARFWMWVNRVLVVCSVLGVLFVTVFTRVGGSVSLLTGFSLPQADGSCHGLTRNRGWST